MMDEAPSCPECGGTMQIMYGCGWDYDRWLCAERDQNRKSLCDGEIELDTTTTPEGME